MSSLPPDAPAMSHGPAHQRPSPDDGAAAAGARIRDTGSRLPETGPHYRLLREHRRILELVARGAPAERCIEELCTTIEHIDPRVGVCVLLTNVERTHFARVLAPRYPMFREAIPSIPIGDGSVASCAQVIVSGDTVVCSDIAGDPRWHERWKSICLASSIRAGFSSPIVDSGSLPLGSVFLSFDVAREPTAWDLSLADMATGVVAVILARDRADEALAESRRALTAELHAARHLQAVSTRMIQADDIHSLYEKILDTAVAIMRSDFASFQLLHPERGNGGELQLIGYRGFSADAASFWEWVRPASESTCGLALRTGRRSIVADVETCEFMAGSADLDAYRETGIRAVQTTPLFSRSGALLGMISTHWREPYEPSENQFRSLDVLARQAADLIERMQSEEALKAANRRKDEFLATLAHELRNPLAPLRNALQVVRLKSDRRETAPSSVEMMERQVDHIVRLVDDLLDVSRVSRGTIALKSERVSLASILSQAADSIRPAFADLEHELTVELPPEPMYVHGDPTRLRQVASNLLHNACKFTGRGGRISLRTHRQGDAAVFSVEDSGSGIEPRHLPHIFDLFMQADTSLARAAGGLGIGLTLVRDLVSMHGGTVEASSEGLGLGTRVVVTLPLAPEASGAARHTAAPPAEPARARLRVLVVDDNHDSADSLMEVLCMDGHDVHVAYDGLDAVAAAATFGPDLILLDIGLPKLDGYEACRRIRRQCAGAPLRVVALTGWGQDSDRRRSAEAGFDRHLVKPINWAALDELLKSVAAESSPPTASGS